jgi:hypothetical protein
VKDKAAEGVKGASAGMPHGAKIQESFGKHDVSGVKSKTGGSAKEAASDIGAEAYAQGENIAFADSPDLHTAAHEAAHVMQQRAGKSPAGGVGKDGDDLEKEADDIADKVVQGESAEAALDAMGGGEGDGEASGDATQSKSVQSKGDGGGMAPPPADNGDAVQRKASGKATDSGGGMAANPGGDDVQKKEGGPAAPEKFRLRVGGVGVTINLPKEFKDKTFTKSVSQRLAPGVNLTGVHVKFNDQWKVVGGSVKGNFNAKLGDKSLKTSWKLAVNKGGTVSGHVKDVPIEDGPLSGTLSAGWGGKKLKGTVKGKITDDVKLGEVKGFGARFLAGTNATLKFTDKKILSASSKKALVMLSQAGEDRVKLSGSGSYKEPKTFKGSGDVDVIKPFTKEAKKAKIESGKKAKGTFKLNLWKFSDLPLSIRFGGGLLKSLKNTFSFTSKGIGGGGGFKVENPFKLPTLKGWTPEIGGRSNFDIKIGGSILKKIKGLTDWSLKQGNLDIFRGLFDGLSFNPDTWSITGQGNGELVNPWKLPKFKGFDFSVGRKGKRSKIKKLGLRKTGLTNFFGNLDLDVFKGTKIAFGSIDLSWLKGGGLKKAKGKYTFPQLPKISMSPYSVKLDKDTTADADYSDNTLKSLKGQIGATVLEGDTPLAGGRFDKASILVAKKQFTGTGSLSLLKEIPLKKRGEYEPIIQPTKGKTASFAFKSNKLQKVSGALGVMVKRGGSAFVLAKANGTYNGKSFTGKGSADLKQNLPFKKGATDGAVTAAGTKLSSAQFVGSELTKASGTLQAKAKTDTKHGLLDVTGKLEKGSVSLKKEPLLTGDLSARLNKKYSIQKGGWTTTIQRESKATINVLDNLARTVTGDPLKLNLEDKDGGKADIDAQTKINLRTVVLNLSASGVLHKGLKLHDDPETSIRRKSKVDELRIGNNMLLSAKGDLGIALKEPGEKKPFGIGDLKGKWARNKGFTGAGKFQLKKEILLAKKGAYEVKLLPTKALTLDGKFTRSKVDKLKGAFSTKILKDGNDFATAEASGTYDGKTFTGEGKANLLARVDFKAKGVEGHIDPAATELSELKITRNAFTRAKGKFGAQVTTKVKGSTLRFAGAVEKATLVGGAQPMLSGKVKATLLEDFTVGGTKKTRVLKDTQLQVDVDNNTPISMSATPLKLFVLEGEKTLAHLEATTKFNLRSLVLDATAKGMLYEGATLLTSPLTKVRKDSPLEKLVVRANEVHHAAGSLDLQFSDKDSKPVGDGLLKGKYLKKKGFTGVGKFNITDEIKLKQDGKWQVVLEPTKTRTLEAKFAKSQLKSFTGSIQARIDKDKKPKARVSASGAYDGKNYTGKGSAKLLESISWKKHETEAILKKEGTALSLVEFQASKFVKATGKAAIQFTTGTGEQKLVMLGKLAKAKIVKGDDLSVSGDVSAELLKTYTIGKENWKTRVKKHAKATLKVRDSKLMTFSASKIALEILEKKKGKVAEVDVAVDFNLRTLVLDAEGSGRLYKTLELGKEGQPRVVVDEGGAVDKLSILGNMPNAITGSVSLTVFDKTNEALVKNAFLKGSWTRGDGFTGSGGAVTARDISAGKEGGYQATLKAESGVKKVEVAKGNFVRADGGELQIAVSDKKGDLLTGRATLKSLVATSDGYSFTGGGGLQLARKIKLGKEGGAGIRLMPPTEVTADVVNNQFSRITGSLNVAADGKDGKEIATGGLNGVDIDMTSAEPVVSGKGNFSTSRKIDIGKVLTIDPKLSAFATIDKNELTEAGLENANFTIHKLNDGKGAKGKVSKAKLGFPKGEWPDFSFLGGAVKDFQMLAGKLVGNLSQLSFVNMRFGGLGTAKYKPNKLFTGDASLRFDPTDAFMLPHMSLKGSIKMPVLPRKEFYKKGMKGQRNWTLLKGGTTIKGVRAGMLINAGFELGTEPIELEASLATAGEFNPEEMEFPDFEAKAAVTGKAYAKARLEFAGRLGAGTEGTAFLGLGASAKPTPKITAGLTPRGTISTTDGKLGGDVGLDFDVTGTAMMDLSLGLVSDFLGMTTEHAEFGKVPIDFGELFKFGWSNTWKFGASAGKEMGGASILGDDPAVQKETEKAYETEKAVTDKPVADFKKTPGGGSGGLKQMEEKVEIMKILLSLTNAGIKLADLIGSSLPPGPKTFKAIVLQNKLLKAADACEELTGIVKSAKDKGVLQPIIDKGGALGTTMEILQAYSDAISEMAGPDVGQMWAAQEGIRGMTSSAFLVYEQANRVIKAQTGSKDSNYTSLGLDWRNTKACHWSDVTSRGAMSRTAGALEYVGAVRDATSPEQEMSDADWARRLKHLKAWWKREDQGNIDKVLPRTPKTDLGS